MQPFRVLQSLICQRLYIPYRISGISFDVSPTPSCGLAPLSAFKNSLKASSVVCKWVSWLSGELPENRDICRCLAKRAERQSRTPWFKIDTWPVPRQVSRFQLQQVHARGRNRSGHCLSGRQSGETWKRLALKSGCKIRNGTKWTHGIGHP